MPSFRCITRGPLTLCPPSRVWLAVLVALAVWFAGNLTEPSSFAQPAEAEPGGEGEADGEPEAAAAPEQWQDVLAAAEAYQATPTAETAQALLAIAERWLERPELRPQQRFDLLELTLEVCRLHGEDERIVAITARFEQELSGDWSIWLLEYQGAALVRLGRDHEVEAVLARLGTFAGEHRLQVAAERAIHGIERARILRVGTRPPAFTLPDVDGAEVSLAAFVGQPVVLVFWGSWHPQCRLLLRDRLASWQRLGEAADAEAEADAETGAESATRGHQPQVLLISREEAAAQVAFRDVHELPWRLLVDEEGRVAEAYRVRGLPFLVQLNAAGQVVRAGFAHEVAAAIEADLAQPAAPASETPPAPPAPPAEEGED